MPTSISPPPERELPPGHHLRRRHQLVNLAQSDGRPSRRWSWVPMVAAASVVALVAAGAVAVQALRPDGTPQVAGTNKVTTKPKPTDSSKPKPPAKAEVPSLTTHEITGAALQRFYDDCVQNDREVYADETPIAFRNFERPLFAFSIDSSSDTDVTAWLVAAQGDGSSMDERALCIRDQWGNVEARGQLASHAAKGDPYLYQIVDGRSTGTGFLMPQVSSVTFQPKVRGGVETAAVVRDGMWFYPEHTPRRSTHEQPPNVDGGLIDLLGGLYRYRGYDAKGKLVYDSAKDGPFVKDCYTDPEGKEVIVVNSVKHPTPATCKRTYEWTAP